MRATDPATTDPPTPLAASAKSLVSCRESGSAPPRRALRNMEDAVEIATQPTRPVEAAVPVDGAAANDGVADGATDGAPEASMSTDRRAPRPAMPPPAPAPSTPLGPTHLSAPARAHPGHVLSLHPPRHSRFPRLPLHLRAAR